MESNLASGADRAREAKRALRARIRQQRRERDPAERAAAGEQIRTMVLELPRLRTARCVALYASLPLEPATGPLRAALRERGVRVLLPLVLPDLDLDWAVDDGTAAPVGGLGGDEPAGPPLGVDAVAEADVVVVPALAVDGLGRRLGQGGGCYDRVLGRVSPSALVFALVHDDEVLDAGTDPVPTEPHDRLVPMVVTPRRWIPIRTPG